MLIMRRRFALSPPAGIAASNSNVVRQSRCSNCTREEASTSTSPPLSPPIHILPPSGMVRQDSRRRSYNNSSFKVMMLKSSQVSPTFPPSLSKKRRYRNIRVPLAFACFFVLVALMNSNGGGGKGRDLRGGATSGLEEAMMQILMTETAALPDEERERVSKKSYHYL